MALLSASHVSAPTRYASSVLVHWIIGGAAVPRLVRVATAYFVLLGAGALGGFVVLPFIAAFGSDGMIRWLAAMPASWGISWFCGGLVSVLLAIGFRRAHRTAVAIGAVALLVPIATPIFRVWWPLDLVISVVGIVLIVASWRALGGNSSAA